MYFLDLQIRITDLLELAYTKKDCPPKISGNLFFCKVYILKQTNF